MKIYFAGSIRGGRDDAALYGEIINVLSEYGQVLTEHIGSADITVAGEIRTSEDIYNRDMEWLLSSDVVIAEVTTVSLGVGYEIGEAAAMNKKILCLYREQEGKRLSAMIEGNPKLEVAHYKGIEDLKVIFDSFLTK